MKKKEKVGKGKTEEALITSRGKSLGQRHFLPKYLYYLKANKNSFLKLQKVLRGGNIKAGEKLKRLERIWHWRTSELRIVSVQINLFAFDLLKGLNCPPWNVMLISNYAEFIAIMIQNTLSRACIKQKIALTY